MKKLATKLVKGDKVKHGNMVGVIIGISLDYYKTIVYDVEIEQCIKTTFSFRKTTQVEIL